MNKRKAGLLRRIKSNTSSQIILSNQQGIMPFNDNHTYFSAQFT